MHKQPKRDRLHTSFNDSVEQRRGDVGIGAGSVMRIALHHPLRPHLYTEERRIVESRKKKHVIRAL